MSVSETPVRFTLRQLPLPAKLVVTAFLFAVGLGYVSAMVQLHLQHSDRDGNPLPTPANVIERFSGLSESPPKSQIEEVISGNPYRGWGSSNMTPAFFGYSGGFYKKDCAERGEEVVRSERHGERLAMIAWINTPAAERKKSYEDNAFPLPASLAGQPVTADFLTEAKAVKINDLICGRCCRCHQEAGGQYPPLATYAQLLPHITTPATELIEGKWYRSGKQMQLEKLTQSTHAHLLTFAILFGLTGLVFAYTGYPTGVRAVLGPLVLIAQAADVACWWLARQPAPYGPMFALTIMGTGAVVGLGLVLQIVLSLLSLYMTKGKVVVFGLVAPAAVAVLLLAGVKDIPNGLETEKKEIEEVLNPVKFPTPPAGPPKKKPDDPVKPPVENPRQPETPPKRGGAEPPAVSHLEKLIMGSRDLKVAPWNGKEKGSMARAFFENESEFKKQAKAGARTLAKLEEEREGERLALQAWLRADPSVRKKAYDEDKFTLPATRASKPLTEDFAADGGKVAKVKSILEARCVTCHASGAEQEKFPLETYEQLMKYVEAKPAADNVSIPPAKE